MEEDEDEYGDDLYSVSTSASKMFNLIHSVPHYFADSYCLFERIMDLGIKELYFKDATYGQREEELQ